MQNETQDHVFLTVRGRQIELTVADGEKIKQALLLYFKSPEVEVEEETLARLEGSITRLDPDGTLRIGSWLLETRFDKIVLTRRRQTRFFFFFDVAYLTLTPDGHWEAVELDYEQVPLRQ